MQRTRLTELNSANYFTTEQSYKELGSQLLLDFAVKTNVTLSLRKVKCYVSSKNSTGTCCPGPWANFFVMHRANQWSCHCIRKP